MLDVWQKLGRSVLPCLNGKLGIISHMKKLPYKMTNHLFFFIFLFFLNLLIFFRFEKISEIFNLYDLPNSSRKIHKKKVPILGGIILFSTLISLLFYLIIFNIENIFFYDDLFLKSFFIPIFGIFFVGLYDDKYHLRAEIKLFIIGVLIAIILNSDDTLIVNKLY